MACLFDKINQGVVHYCDGTQPIGIGFLRFVIWISMVTYNTCSYTSLACSRSMYIYYSRERDKTQSVASYNIAFSTLENEAPAVFRHWNASTLLTVRRINFVEWPKVIPEKVIPAGVFLDVGQRNLYQGVTKLCRHEARYHASIINTLGPKVAICRHIMACWLTIPSHYLN